MQYINPCNDDFTNVRHFQLEKGKEENVQQAKESVKLLFQVVDKLREYSGRYHKRNQDELAKVTIGQLRVMKAVAAFWEESPEGSMMLKTLVAKVNLTPGATSIIVDHLVKNGFLERKQDEQDRRAVRISLSPEGAKHLDQRIGFFGMTMHRFLSDYTEEEIATFLKILRGLKEKIENEENA